MVLAYPTQASNDIVEEKFVYAGWCPTKEKGNAQEDMDRSSKYKYKGMQPTQGFG